MERKIKTLGFFIGLFYLIAALSRVILSECMLYVDCMTKFKFLTFVREGYSPDIIVILDDDTSDKEENIFQTAEQKLTHAFDLRRISSTIPR